MEIAISTVYALGMPKYVFIQMHGKDGAIPQPIRIRADAFEKDQTGRMILRLGKETIGEFNASSIAGWWIEDAPS